MHCGFANEAEDRFCGGCGTSLSAATESVTVAKEPSAPRITTEDTPERRQLTVLFCDLADSTELASRLDPEDLNALNQSYQTTCSHVIKKFGGYVARYMGDGILCYFGYPKAHENDSELAIRAALEIQQAIQVLDYPEKISVRVGIATGEVVVGDIVGEGFSQESTAVGQTPNLAARLQGIAAPGAVLVSSTTRMLAGDMFEYLDLGEITIKGIPEPEPVSQVLSCSLARSRFQARSSRALSPIVGRKHERALIEDCFDEAAKGNGQVMLLCGEPGIGKSRLTMEAMAMSPGSSDTLQCAPHQENNALYAFAEFMRSNRANAMDAGKPWPDEFMANRGIEESNTAALTELLLDGHTSGEAQVTDPKIQKQQTLTMASRILLSNPSKTASVLVIEDLHWIDPTTLELVNRLVHEIRSSRTLMLLTFRPEFTHDWVGQSHAVSYTHLTLPTKIV